MVAEGMADAGYSEREIQMFLAGATMLGYLADDRASWAREHLVRKFFSHVDPWDTRIDAAGETSIDWRLWEKAEQVEQDTALKLSAMNRESKAARAIRRAQEADERKAKKAHAQRKTIV